MGAPPLERCSQCDLLHPPYPVCPFTSQVSIGSPTTTEELASLELPGRLEGRVVGHYRVGSILASGGMGAVYRAEHVGLGRAAAFKVLRPRHRAGAADRLRREARALSQLRHPNVVAVLDAGELDDGSPYLVMELLEGETLAERLSRGSIEVVAALEMAVDVLAGLAAAHALGIVHRDVTPRNVLLVPGPGPRSVAKLLDFGLAKVLTDVTLTGAGEVLGTPHYVAPEQARGQVHVGPAADLWSTGVLLFEALTRTMPFDADSIPALLLRILSTEPPPASRFRAAIPPGVDALVLRALAKDPDERWPSAREMRTALMDLLDTLDPLTRTVEDASNRTLPDARLDAAETLQQEVPADVLEAFRRSGR